MDDPEFRDYVSNTLSILLERSASHKDEHVALNMRIGDVEKEQRGLAWKFIAVLGAGLTFAATALYNVLTGKH